MTKIIIKNYEYTGLGFPIKLKNVEMIKVDNDFYPKIDVKKVANLAMRALVIQEARLTGNQIKFIRTFFSMSLRGFASVVNESHMAVKKWEDFKDYPTNMDPNIEILLRLHIYDEMIIKPKKKVKEKQGFYNLYSALTKLFTSQQINTKIISTKQHKNLPKVKRTQESKTDHVKI